MGSLPEEFLLLVVVGSGEGAAGTCSRAKKRPKKLTEEVIRLRPSRGKRRAGETQVAKDEAPGKGPRAAGGPKKSDPSRPLPSLGQGRDHI